MNNLNSLNNKNLTSIIAGTKNFNPDQCKLAYSPSLCYNFSRLGKSCSKCENYISNPISIKNRYYGCKLDIPAVYCMKYTRLGNTCKTCENRIFIDSSDIEDIKLI